MNKRYPSDYKIDKRINDNLKEWANGVECKEMGDWFNISNIPQYTPIEVLEMWDKHLEIAHGECRCWSYNFQDKIKIYDEMALNFLVFLGVEI